MTAKSGSNIQIVSTWNVSKDDSLGTSLLDLANIEIINKNNEENQPNYDLHGNSDNQTSLDNIVDLVDLSKFLILEDTANDSPDHECMIKITTHYPIIRISLVLDVGKIEVFTGAGNLCSYWKTVNGLNVDEFSELDTKIYRYDLDLPPLITCFETKLHSKMSSVMLIGLKVRVMGNQAFTAHHSRFNFNNVESLLSGSSLPLSDGARKALNFMKATDSVSQFSMPKNFEVSALLPQPGTRPNLGPAPSFNEFMNMFNSQLSLQSVTQGDEPKQGQTEEKLETHIQNYLDVRLREMEEKLKLYFDSSLKAIVSEQNQKLDLILSALNK